MLLLESLSSGTFQLSACHRLKPLKALTIFVLFSSAPDARRASKPNEFAIVPPEDLTYQFLHTFAHSKGYKRDYLDEWLTDYPKK